MQNAIQIVFPEARHRWCLWHIMKKIPEKLRGYGQYEPIKFALQNAVYDSLTKDEFDNEWKIMIEKFDLYENEWLGVLYNERHRWVPVYVKDVFWAGMSTTQRSESMNAFFDGYVNSKTTLKQFVEQYDNALRSKVEKEKKSDFKSRHKMYDCLTLYDIEKQFQGAYTNAKFKEVQGEFKRLVYCVPSLLKEEGSICTYNVKEVILDGRWKHLELIVYFNSTEFEVQCMCRLFEFRGIMCCHSLSVLISRLMMEVPDKYILPRWRKDLDRGYTYIKIGYNNLGVALNRKFHDKVQNKLNEIVHIAGNSEEKQKIVECGLDAIKDRVLKDESRCVSNVPSSSVPPATFAPQSPHDSTRQTKSSKIVRSPLVGRRRGRPVTKRRVGKVDEIVSRLKARKTKQTKKKVDKVVDGTVNVSMDGTIIGLGRSADNATTSVIPLQTVDGIGGPCVTSWQMVDRIGQTSFTSWQMVDAMGRQSLGASSENHGHTIQFFGDLNM